MVSFNNSGRTELYPYYMTCKTCGWEQWLEEKDWLSKSLDHMEASTWKHNRTVNIGETVFTWGGNSISSVARYFRNLMVS